MNSIYLIKQMTLGDEDALELFKTIASNHCMKANNKNGFSTLLADNPSPRWPMAVNH